MSGSISGIRSFNFPMPACGQQLVPYCRQKSLADAFEQNPE